MDRRLKSPKPFRAPNLEHILHKSFSSMSTRQLWLRIYFWNSDSLPFPATVSHQMSWNQVEAEIRISPVATDPRYNWIVPTFSARALPTPRNYLYLFVSSSLADAQKMREISSPSAIRMKSFRRARFRAIQLRKNYTQATLDRVVNFCKPERGERRVAIVNKLKSN